MDQVIQQIGSTIGGFFGNPLVQLAFRAFAVYMVVLWLASAYWAFRDLQGRTDNPIAPYVAASLIILCTPAFFLLGIVVYRTVRPHEKIGEVNERTLAEEALLNEVEAVAHCAGCNRRINEEWLICPTCRTRLHRVCPNCSRLVGLDWSLCAWCGRDFERREVVPAAAAVPSRGMWAPAPAPSVPIAAAASVPPEAPPVAQPPARKRGIRAPSSRRSPGPLPER